MQKRGVQWWVLGCLVLVTACATPRGRRSDDASSADVSGSDDAGATTDGTDAGDGTDASDGTDGSEGSEGTEGTDGSEGTDSSDSSDGTDSTDAPTACESDKDCDDGSVCTTDICGVGGLCKHLPAPGPCDDGNPCTLGDACAEGACTGPLKECGDGNPCTDDFCDPATGSCAYPDNADPCDDGEPCTEDDLCAGGSCAGTAKVCDDGDPCTTDACFGGDCVVNDAPNGTACDDDNKCTTVDKCQTGACVGSSPKPCDDGELCTNDGCDKVTGLCIHAANTLSCSDGNACTIGDVCANKKCKPGTVKSCDDSNPCTDDTCNTVSGTCGHQNNTKSCNDGKFCTTGDKCAAGQCAGGAAPACDDNNPCTTDSCDTLTDACKHSFNALSCNDGDACTVGDTCGGGSCKPGTPKNCDDGKQCTDDTCQNGTCKNTNDNANLCSDGDSCTLSDKCQSGTCVGTPKVCDDNNPCTVGDNCKTGLCYSGTPKNCDDGKVCTNDVCETATGLCKSTNLAAGSTCDNGKPCVDATCQGSTCVDGGATDCDDDSLCTQDSCDPLTGCKNAAIACDDGIACTIDTCVAAVGCVFTLDDASCDDGVACTVDTCTDPGGCVNEVDHAACDDGQECSTDICHESAGCLVFSDDPACCGGAGINANFEGGTLPAGWTTKASDTAVKWQAVTGKQAKSGTGAVYYGNLAAGNFQGSGANSGSIFLTPFTPSDGANLTFEYWFDTEASASYDRLSVYVGTVKLWGKPANLAKSTWHSIEVSLDAYAGDEITLEFRFETVDSTSNTGAGVYLDDIVVDACGALAACNPLDPAFCDDSDVCTVDTCDALTGCQYDADACDDGLACTLDSCAPDTGECSYEPDDGACDDGIDCTVETCVVGEGCVPTPEHSACDDDLDCSVDLCSVTQGCIAWYPEDCCGNGTLVDFEGGTMPEGWTVTGSSSAVTWRVATGAVAYEGTSALYYGNAGYTSYSTGSAANSGTVTLPPVAVSDALVPELRFFLWHETEVSATYDKVVVKVNGQTAWSKGTAQTASKWHEVVIDLGSFSGPQLVIAIEFNTVDDFENDGQGVFIDNLQISSICGEGAACNPLDDSCDDSDPCTADACDVDTGCVHTPICD